MKRLIGWIARILLDPWLLYWAQLSTHEGGMVQVDTISAGPLMVVTTGSMLPQGPLAEPDAAGVLFRATKDPDQPRVVAMVALSPLPTGLPQRFTLVADFSLSPEIGPWSVGVMGAATLGMRNGDDPDDFNLLGATHQFRNLASDGTSKIGLGVGGGATANTTMPPGDFVVPSVPYPDARRQFTLETDIHLDERRGWSRLRTPNKTWDERSWQFDTSGFPQITGIGFGLFFAQGTGTATVTATAFRIYANRRRWLRWLLSLAAGTAR